MESYFDEIEIWSTPGTEDIDLFPIGDELVLVYAQNYKQSVSIIILII